MTTRGTWPNGANPWAVWNVGRANYEALKQERQPSGAETTPSLAGKVLAGHQPTDQEARSLAGAVLSAKARASTE
jgi:hypothetical protein